MSITIKNNQIIILNPATLNEVGKVKVSNKEDVDTALKIAQEYKEWSSLSLKKRCAIIHKFRKIVFKNSELLKKTIKDETGKKELIGLLKE
ncbi:aldehyde dehydrogenase family protein [Candidatus Marinimicrobia bacterium]|nr:aldehyde dehydrogenase family protein [Candidatus Neomarinimicrobiota bacterium]